ncbi:hypothetical protein ALC53_05258 [Atta colombica]|uniref:Uncharacterized protein n=1 Tax=Atta colombica TaxID=520822 RepID=A0A195BJA0_9HYME|nr:hypothetical protein ALC53_05258 [Atta colombica]
MRYRLTYRRARMQGRSNVFPGHAFDRHNGTPTIKLRTRRILEISFNNELNIIAILRAYFLLKNKLLNVGVHPYSREGIERWFFSINLRPSLAYPFEERSSRGLRQHSGVSTRFRCENYKLNKMDFSLCESVIYFHISRGIILDTSDFTQYLNRHSKLDRPVRGQSFISFSLRSGSLVL